MIGGGHASVSAATIAADLHAALVATDPATVDPAWSVAAVNRNWSICQNGDPTTIGDQTNNKFSSCENLVFYLYDAYVKLADPAYLPRAKAMYDYTYGHFPGADYRSNLNQSLTVDFP